MASGMETFYNVLFEYSNEDRHRILLQLDQGAMNVTQLSKKLDLTLPETSRHLFRIVKVGLARKESDGYYYINPFGKLCLNHLQGLEFISKHRGYFNSHSLAHLSKEFIDRIGDLTEGTYSNDVMVVFHKISTGIEDAEEYVFAMLDQYPLSTVPLVREAYKRGVKIKVIEPKEWVAPPEFYSAREKEMTEWGFQAMKTGLLEFIALERIPLFLYMTEKEVSALSFPTIDGKFDYLGFSATDERVHKWCMDLFQYYWKKANPPREP